MSRLRVCCRFLLSLGLALLLAGCALRPPAPVAELKTVAIDEWSVPAAPSQWQLTGRASMVAGEEGATASVQWQENNSEYRIDLQGALGAGSVRLQGDDDTVVLTTAAARRYTASSPRALLNAVTGYDLPVGYLRWWMTGRPVPSLAGTVSLDPSHRVRRIEQGDWVVQLDGWQVISGFALPGKVSVVGGDRRLRLVIRRWQVGQ